MMKKGECEGCGTGDVDLNDSDKCLNCDGGVPSSEKTDDGMEKTDGHNKEADTGSTEEAVQ